ncbi:hypothetical protein BH11BAC7_BH11BAC7_00560 [soil metagenome]
MFIAVKHTINNPGEFWTRAKASLPNLPNGIKIHSVLPNEEMNDAVCLWEANSLGHLKTYLEEKTGDVSDNHYIPVNEANAMGLPTP